MELAEATSLGEEPCGAGPQNLDEGILLSVLVPLWGCSKAGSGSISKSWRMEARGTHPSCSLPACLPPVPHVVDANQKPAD